MLSKTNMFLSKIENEKLSNPWVNKNKISDGNSVNITQRIYFFMILV